MIAILDEALSLRDSLSARKKQLQTGLGAPADAESQPLVSYKERCQLAEARWASLKAAAQEHLKMPAQADDLDQVGRALERLNDFFEGEWQQGVLDFMELEKELAKDEALKKRVSAVLDELDSFNTRLDEQQNVLGEKYEQLLVQACRQGRDDLEKKQRRYEELRKTPAGEKELKALATDIIKQAQHVLKNLNLVADSSETRVLKSQVEAVYQQFAGLG